MAQLAGSPPGLASPARRVALAAKVAVALTLPWAWTTALGLIGGRQLSLGESASRAAFVLALLAAVNADLLPRWRWRASTCVPATLGATLGLSGALLASSGRAIWGWLALLAFWGLLLWAHRAVSAWPDWLPRWAGRGLLVLAASSIPVAAAQIESRFSEEEFFAAVELLGLAGLAALVGLSDTLVRPARPEPAAPHNRGSAWLAAITASLVVAAAATVHGYQGSAFPAAAPGYKAIDESSPFICGEVAPDSQVYDGTVVYRDYLSLLAGNPSKESPEYGALALGTRERGWAAAFRAALLEEAAQGRYTGPANSVKYGQHDAAARAYYYPLVRDAFPGLFSPDDDAVVRGWLAAVNRRAMTTEWVDWAYSLALGEDLRGPYENQEIGAGLLATLAKGGLEAPELTAANRQYLERRARGWLARFRNTDDAITYQPEWLTNAYYQALLVGLPASGNVARSFEWLALQALPDGSSPHYNMPAGNVQAGAFYLGASLLRDPRYVWLAGRALDEARGRAARVAAQPGVEGPVSLAGASPTWGSCLLYGDSGLPNQVGPLAPDKIVFRDGWSPGSTYVLLNLRFTGWHRYKATNTISLVDRGGPLIADQLSGRPFSWLPVGRSLFRDKRVPRENLSGLLIPRSGLSAAVGVLAGSGGPWAQDPPSYARVASFQTGPDADSSTTLVSGWHGWQHRREVRFYHQGPIVVIDAARGPDGEVPALAWQVPATAGVGDPAARRIELRGGEDPAELVVLPLGQSGAQVTVEPVADGAGSTVLVTPLTPGRLDVATVLLTGDWVGADATVVGDQANTVIHVAKGGRSIDVAGLARGELQDGDGLAR